MSSEKFDQVGSGRTSAENESSGLEDAKIILFKTSAL